jgi:nitrite reductase/ring-hydroxylating ferredoxin subunit
MFIRNAWYIAAWDDELTDNPLARRILNEPVVLFRDKAGKAAAIADRCCHRGTPLSLGEVVDQGLQCGYHGMVFDGAGKCVHIPGQDKIPDKAFVPAYPVVERDRFIWIWMGEAAKADPARIVDVPWHRNAERWGHRHAVIPIKGSYILMVDNLMDLTHLGYVHKRTVGGNPATHIEAKMETARTQSGVRFTRWMLSSVPPPTYVAAYGFKGKVDRWQEFEWVAPSSVLQWTGAKDAGQGAPEGDREGSYSRFSTASRPRPRRAASISGPRPTVSRCRTRKPPTISPPPSPSPSTRTRPLSRNSRSGSANSARIGSRISPRTGHACRCAASSTISWRTSASLRRSRVSYSAIFPPEREGRIGAG